jgi:hypothetical protein
MVLFPCFWDNFYLLPALFAAFVLALAAMPLSRAGLPALWRLGLGIPSFSYILLAFFFAGKSALRERRPLVFLFLPPLFLCCHFSYGMGLLWGLFRHPLFLRPRPVASVEIVRLKGFGDPPPLGAGLRLV